MTLNEKGQVDESAYQYLSDAQISQLTLLNERKEALQSKISQKDAKDMMDLINFMKTNKLKILDQLDETSADEIQKAFNLKSKEQIEAILQKTDRLTNSIASTRDEFSDYLHSFHQKKQQ